jgi:hypothetical protein
MAWIRVLGGGVGAGVTSALRTLGAIATVSEWEHARGAAGRSLTVSTYYDG